MSDLNLDGKSIGRFPARKRVYDDSEDETTLAAPPLLFYLDSSGKISAAGTKSGFGWGGGDNYSFSISSPYADVPMQANKIGYAYSATVSVWAARCIEVRAQAVTRIRREVVDHRTKKPIPNHPYNLAIQRAHKHGQDIYSLWERSKLTFGEVFLWPMVNAYQYASDIQWLNNMGTDPITVGGYISGFTYVPTNGGAVHQFNDDEIAFYRTDNWFNDLRGLSPLDSILLELGIDKDVSRVTRAWYTNDARPGLLLIPENDIGEQQGQAFMDYWKQNFGGAKNAGKPVVLPRIIKEIKEMNRAPSPDDVQIRESMRREICARFGVPLSIAGAWDDAQYQSAPEQRKSLYEETIIPECENLDKWLTNAVLPFFDDSGATEIVSDLTDIKALIEDEGTKSAINNQRLLSGGISFNEYRKELLQPAVPEDFFYRPVGTVVVPYAEVSIPTPVQAPAQPQFGGGFGAMPQQPQGAVLPKVSTGKEALDELAAWRKKALNGGAIKALMFVCYELPKDIESTIRSGLKPDMDKTALKALFDSVKLDDTEENTDEPEDVRIGRFHFDDYEIVSNAEKAFDESKHPRADDGKFGEGSGGSSGDSSNDKKPTTDKPEAKKPTQKPEEKEPPPPDEKKKYKDFSGQSDKKLTQEFSSGVPKPTQQQYNAVEYYRTDEGAKALNASLRTGKPLDATGKAHLKEMDSLVNNSTLNQDTTLYRGIMNGSAQMNQFKSDIASGKIKVGTVMKDNGFASTTVDKNVAVNDFVNGPFRKGGATFKIEAPKGSHGMYMNAAVSNFTGQDYKGKFKGEKEVVLPRGSQFRVKSINSTSNGFNYEVVMELVSSGGAGKSVSIALDRSEDIKKKSLEGVVTPTPEEIAGYWQDFDSLYADIGSEWLNQYMRKAWERIKPQIRRGMTSDDVLRALDDLRDDLANEWIGTEDNPGVISQLTLAGMAAGNHALEDGKAHNPVKAALTVDWSLLNRQAVDFARSYTYNLIRGLDATTQNDVQNAVANWITSGSPLNTLESALRDIFQNEARAALIAQTESTRAYNAGAKERWTQVGVQRARWQTVRDNHVCPTCEELSQQDYDLEQGAWSELLGKYVTQPVHPGCRCFSRPLPPEKEDVNPIAAAEPAQVLTTRGYVPADTGRPGQTPESLARFLSQSIGQLAETLKDPDLGLTQLNFDTDNYEVDPDRTKQVARQFVIESQNIQYGKDYLVSLAQEEAQGNGLDIDENTAETLYNDFYATRADAILTAAEIGNVKLTEAQQRRLEAARDGNYLDTVYTTESSLAGSLSNQTKRTVTYGGNFYATDAARREARREFLDRMGRLDTGS